MACGRLKLLNATVLRFRRMYSIKFYSTSSNTVSVEKEKKSIGIGSPIVPSLAPDRIPSFSKVLSLNITGNRLSWSLIHRLPSPYANKQSQTETEPCRLHLQSLNLTAFDLTPKTHFIHLLNQVSP